MALRRRWKGAAAAEGLVEVELSVGVAAALRGLHWSSRWGSSWRGEPPRWQKKKRRRKMLRTQKGACEEFLRMRPS